MNSQKLFVIVLALNIAMVFISGIYFNFTFAETNANNEILLGTNYGNELYDSEVQIPNREGTDIESTAGNPLEQSVSLWDILKRGLNPFPISTDYEYNDRVEQYAVNILQWFRGILVFLLGLELFLVFKNKKAS